MALDAAKVMRSLVERFREHGFNDRHIDVAPQCEDEWDRNFANVELHVEEPGNDHDRRYFDYHTYCQDLCDEIAAAFKEHGRFRVVWNKRSMLSVAGAKPVKPGDRVLGFEVTPFWSVRVEFYVKQKPVTRAQVRA